MMIPPIVGVPALTWWACRPLLADELAELALLQEVDELRRQEDADEQRRGAGDEDLAHGCVYAAAAARRPCGDDLEADATRALDEHRVARRHELGHERGGRRGVVDARAARRRSDSRHPAARGPTVTRTSTPAAASRGRRAPRGSAPPRDRARACRRARRRDARTRTRRGRRGRRASTSGWRCSSRR